MKIIIAGGRKTHLKTSQKEFLLSLIEKNIITELVCGMAAGIDIDTYNLFKGLIPISEHPALWNDLTVDNCIIRFGKGGYKYNQLAGFNRNDEMAEYADALIYFNGGNGTAHMVTSATLKNLKVASIFEEDKILNWETK